MIDRHYQLIEALEHIVGWCSAYPTGIFSPVNEKTLQEASSVLQERGISLANIHAQWARHILEGVESIANEALKGADYGDEDEDQGLQGQGEDR